ncbi:MAG: hypothetical protein LVQ63_06115 [Thermoplasmatales archaeon]|nr:hypothetical protein [Thermoplasmatales archaeon]
MEIRETGGINVNNNGFKKEYVTGRKDHYGLHGNIAGRISARTGVKFSGTSAGTPTQRTWSRETWTCKP